MERTNIEILKQLKLNIGDEITLYELNERIRKLIDNEDINTPLDVISENEIVSFFRCFYFYLGEDTGPHYIINFELVEYVRYGYAIIRIIE